MKRSRRVLGEEEALLWAGVARSVQPLPGRVVPSFPLPKPAEQQADARPASDTRPAASSGSPAPTPARVRAAAKPLLAPLHPIERPVQRKLAKGRLPIDARIDLHEMTESVAHLTLLAFLRRGRVGGMRHVLVITGRGSSPGSRGALKRALPHWFDTPDFRALVAGFETAARGHGGEGAFYVRLRRN